MPWMVPTKGVLDKLSEIRKDPFDSRISKALVSRQGARSARVGQWRIIFYVQSGHGQESDGNVLVVAIQSRGKVYERN